MSENIIKNIDKQKNNNKFDENRTNKKSKGRRNKPRKRI